VAEISRLPARSGRRIFAQDQAPSQPDEDHLDRYETFGLCRAKERDLARQKKEDNALLNADDPLVSLGSRAWSPRVLLFSARAGGSFWLLPDAGGDYFSGLTARGRGLTWAGSGSRGSHLENLMAAIAVAKMCGCPREALQRVYGRISGASAHRLEWVRRLDG